MGKNAKQHVDEGPHQAAVSAVQQAKHAIVVVPQRVTSGAAAAITPTTTTTTVNDENEKAACNENRKRKEPTTGNDENDTVPSDEDVILSILTKRMWSEDAKDVEDALEELDESLWDFVEGKPKKKNCATAFKLGAPLAVVRVMTQHQTNACIQKRASNVLSSLAFDDVVDQNASLVKLGAIKRAVWDMDHFGESPDVLSAACRLIGNTIDDDLAKEIVGAGGLRVTISAMKKHQNDHAVQDYGCFVLRKLVDLTDHWGALQVVDASGIDLVITAMKNHANDADVLDEGCMVLAKLAELNLADHRRKIIEANGLAALSEIVRIYKYQDDPKGIFEDASKAMTLLVSSE